MSRHVLCQRCQTFAESQVTAVVPVSWEDAPFEQKECPYRRYFFSYPETSIYQMTELERHIFLRFQSREAHFLWTGGNDDIFGALQTRYEDSIHSISDEPLPEPECNERLIGDHEQSLFCQSWDTVINSAAHGCHLCNLVSGFLKRQIEPEQLTSISGASSSAHVAVLPLLSTWISYDERYLDFMLVDTNPWKQLGSARMPLTIVESASAQQLPHTETAKGSFSPSTAARILRWISRCKAIPDPESTYRTNWLAKDVKTIPWIPPKQRPTRLLHVASGGVLACLVTTQQDNEQKPYVAISHRWGKDGIPQCLVQDRLEAYTKQIIVADLPRTFRDAIKVTISLGFEYIWIDALCIIQDDSADWAFEAPRMRAIYSNSALTLSATMSEGPDSGLLTQDILLTPCWITQDWFGTGSASTMQIDDPGQWTLSGTLRKRAWVFQERFLSPFLIEFGLDQIYWFSSCGSGCETTPSTYKTKSTDKGQWENIIKDYSLTYLTYPNDRLVGFAGIAEFEGIRRGFNVQTDYLAGLWRYFFYEQLLWYAVDPRRRLQYKSNRWNRTEATGVELPQSEVYNAPSWSWASVEGELGFFCGSKGHCHQDPLLTILSIDVKTVNENSLSAVRSGSLRLQCPLWSIELPLDVVRRERSLDSVTVGGLTFNARNPFDYKDEMTCYAHLDPRHMSPKKDGASERGDDKSESIHSVIKDRSSGSNASYFSSWWQQLLYDNSADTKRTSLDTSAGLEGRRRTHDPTYMLCPIGSKDKWHNWFLLLVHNEGVKGQYRRLGVLDLRTPRGQSWYTVTMDWSPDLPEELFLQKNEDCLYDIEII